MNNIKFNIMEYGKKLCSIGFDIGSSPRILVKDGRKVYGTRVGADLNSLVTDDIADISMTADPLKAALVQNKLYRVLLVTRTEYTGMCIEEGLPLPAVLDDMAQIVGTDVEIVSGDRFSVAKALNKAAAVMTESGELITCGRNLYEAQNCLMVLEKNAEIFIDADFLGGASPVRKVPGVIEHAVYLNKYSKAEMKKQSELSHAVTEAAEESAAPESEEADLRMYGEKELAARRLLVRYGNRLVESGLVVGTWGNLSVRLDDHWMLCSPSGRDYRELSVHDYVKVDMDTLEYQGDLKPTSEKSFHAGIYRNRPDVGAIIHTHSKYACVFAACDKSFETTKGEEIRCANYALSGTKLLSRFVREAVADNTGCLMSHHGMVAVGADIETAFHNARSIENAAHEYIEKCWKED